MEHPKKPIGLIMAGMLAGVLIVFAFPQVFPNSFFRESLMGYSSGFTTSTLSAWGAQNGFTQDMYVGARGASVSYMQAYLKKLYPSLYLSVDGTLGNRTSSALTVFQSDSNIEQTGILDASTREALNKRILNELCPYGSSENVDLSLFPISKQAGIAQEYTPASLVVLPENVHPKGIVCLESATAQAYIQMYESAESVGVTLGITSGFRKYDMQNYLFNLYVNMMGYKEASRVSALPGYSEHQLGTAVDLTGSTLGFASTSRNLPYTKEGVWLENNAHTFGFVLSYPEYSEHITGYDFEPWHYRYVGIENAQYIKDSNLIPLEYLEDLQNQELE